MGVCAGFGKLKKIGLQDSTPYLDKRKIKFISNVIMVEISRGENMVIFLVILKNNVKKY